MINGGFLDLSFGKMVNFSNICFLQIAYYFQKGCITKFCFKVLYSDTIFSIPFWNEVMLPSGKNSR